MNDLSLSHLQDLHITGVKINYFFVCPRKLWLFDRGLTMEQQSDRVFLGKLLDESAYPREKKRNITLDNLISIDILDNNTIQEVKYGKTLEKASTMQLAYYLFYLRKFGIEREGLLTYPRLRKREKVILTDELIQELENAIQEISILIQFTKPPEVIRKPYCSKCAYFEFCFG
jgi:CRISPR-associated exonuclease Cas4